MKKFSVTIEAVVRKVYIVEAEDSQAAQDLAHQQFTTLPEDDVPERYDQQILDCSLVSEIPVAYGSIGNRPDVV